MTILERHRELAFRLKLEAKSMKAILWTGGDAPNKEAKLTVTTTAGPRSMQLCAYWEPGFCGCEDCHPCVGYGATEQEAIADYWVNWEEKHGEFAKLEEGYWDSRAGTQ